MTSHTDHSVTVIGGQPFSSQATDTTKSGELPGWLGGKIFTMSAEVKTLDRQTKVAKFRDFEILSDEPHWLGGDDQYPQPLTFLAASVGFCLLTQIGRYAAMTKKSITKAECKCEFDITQTGSVLRGDVQAKVLGFRTHLIIESPEAAADIAKIITMAKRGCYAEQLVTTPVTLTSTYELNGRNFELDIEPVVTAES